ncbi:hypothetical protein EXIGLDRAFT_470396 [Exidia glandulosa HHB12029]|uniref:Uncharacterized protein n=1 Tax=Exidia glandulosa HHB12029 TaxID=1314781 RepID=A0A165JYR5_EXIGL|nr:hypothetical protein EXIGLDRAFT_470396 [Exidia glandulosa HHB12029]
MTGADVVWRLFCTDKSVRRPEKRREMGQDALERARILRRLRRSLRERFFFHFSRIYEGNRQHRVRQRRWARRGSWATRQGTHGALNRATTGSAATPPTTTTRTRSRRERRGAQRGRRQERARGRRAHLLVVWGEKVSGGDQQTGDGRSI